MRLLCPIVRVLISYMDGIRYHLPMRDPITPQLVRHALPGLITVCFQQAFEEAFGSSSLPPNLQKHTNNFTILVNGAPEIVLLPVDLDEDLIDEIGRVCRYSSPDYRSGGVNLSVLSQSAGSRHLLLLPPIHAPFYSVFNCRSNFNAP